MDFKIISSSLIILFSLLGLNMQENNFDYNQAWKEVQQLRQDGLPTSAMEKVEFIYQQADQEKNYAQKTKAIAFKGELLIETKENGVEAVIDFYEKEITNTPSPYQQILKSNLAKFYQNYFRQNRYKISQRIGLDESIDSNVRTMSPQSFLNRINRLYQASVTKKEELNIPIEEISPLLIDGYTAKGKLRRPTVYDVLAERIINYYNEGEQRQTLPNDHFRVNKEEYFSPSVEYCRLDISSSDANSPLYNALSVYQDILRDRPNSDAMVNFDNMRLGYVYRHYSGPQKDSLYLNALFQLEKTAKPYEEYSSICVNIASIYNKNQTFESKTKAIEWAQKAKDAYPKSNGAVNARSLIFNIKMPLLQLYGLEGYPLNSNNTITVETKNANVVRYQLVKVDPNSVVDYITNRNNNWEKDFSRHQKIKTWTEQVNSKPYTSKKQLLNLPKVDYGFYLLKADVVTKDQPATSYIAFTITDLAFLTSAHKEGSSLFTINRKKGNPIKGVTVEYYTQVYDYNTRNTTLNYLKKLTSGKEGRAKIIGSKRGLMVKLTNGNDVFYPKGQVYPLHFNTPSSRQSVEIYTDRSIYRPGQTVYFKGLSLEYSDKGIPSLLTNKSIEVTFKDANHQQIIKRKYKSNEFGSIEGSLTIPTGLLTGNFTLQTPFGSKYFKVEEYKRPTFDVILDTLEERIALGDTVNLKGKVKAFAGNMINEADVKYTVYRQLYYPRFCLYRPYPAQKELITSGGTLSDGQGEFDIYFKTRKENTETIRGIRYQYSVEVEAIDQSGETRRVKKMVSLLDTEFTLDIKHEESIDLDEKGHITISSSNIEGIKIASTGTYTITELLKTQRISVPENRYGQNPYAQWKNGAVVQSGDYQSEIPLTLNKNLDVGFYRITAISKDSKGNIVEVDSYLKLQRKAKYKFPKTDLLIVDMDKETYQPGDVVNIEVFTSSPKAYGYYTLNKGSKVIQSGWLDIKNKESINYRINESDRGSITLTIMGAKDNELFSYTKRIDIPWTNKELDIEFASFRDNLLPGAKEKYTIRIKPKQGSLSQSEILMAMYDASLDALNPHQWRSNFYGDQPGNIVRNSGGFMRSYPYRHYYPANNDFGSFQTIVYPHIYGFGYQRNRLMMSNEVEMDESLPPPRSQPMGKSSRSSSQVDKLESRNVDAVMAESAGLSPEVEAKSQIKETVITPRTNLNETVFFYPSIVSDEDGNAVIELEMNEALTKWRLMTLVHNKDFALGYDERFLTTSKDVMILPNNPRYIRLGDTIWSTARVINMTQKPIDFEAEISLEDGLTSVDLMSMIQANEGNRSTVGPNESKTVRFKIAVPKEVELDLLKITHSVRSSDHVDAEQSVLPVITDLFKVVETESIYVNGGASKNIQFEGLKRVNEEGRVNKNYTVEYTSNPIWFAIQALPYLHTNSESTISLLDEYYGNSLGKDIIEKHPTIEAVFKIWRENGKENLQSTLLKNEELKNTLLEETPWVRNALSETQQKNEIASFFNKITLDNRLRSILTKVAKRQTSNGGFTWISGGRDNPHTTLYVLETLGKLNALGINTNFRKDQIKKAAFYTDDRLTDRYNKIKKNTGEAYVPSFYIVYTLATRSLHQEISIQKKNQKAYDFFLKQSIKNWAKMDIYTQAILGQHLVRLEHSASESIKKSLLERSFESDELGRYWNAGNGYDWHQLPIERHAAIHDFLASTDVGVDFLNDMKVWLIKHKQVNRWATTKSTTAAIYSLINNRGNRESQLSTESDVTVKVKDETLTAKGQAGTGYIKRSYHGDQITKEKANVSIINNTNHITWGGIYYTYLAPSSDIEADHNGPLSIEKEFYKLIVTKDGEQLVELKEETLNPGDVLVSRMIVRSDRDMQFINIKDYRASGVEPTEVLSGYRWKSGLGYYHSIRDMADRYYMTNLRKGTYTFEQKLRVVHKGTFSSGLATIQSSYAPEFGSHSKGIIINVE